MGQIAKIGDNNPPSEFDEISQEINDLYEEAENWIDGEPITNQAQADSVEKLAGMLKDAISRADTERKSESQPYDEAKKKIQDKYNKLIGKTKAVTGTAVLALNACNDTLTPWKQALQAKKDEEERQKREEAEKLMREAEIKRSAANLNDRQEAQKLAEQSLKLQKSANKDNLENVKGMRTVWDVEITDQADAFRSIWRTRQADIMEYVLQLAKEQVRNGQRTISGFNITSRKVAK